MTGTGIRKEDKIFVAGHRGLLGSALVEVLEQKGYKNIITRTRQELDLCNQVAVEAFYAEQKPDVVFMTAAKVGGIHANNTYRADFIGENLQIQNNVIWGAHKADVRRLVFLGSSCIYPRNCPQPMKEEYLLTGELEYTNKPYAIAKIAGLELVNSIRQQYGRDWFSVMPTNLYGPRDNFDLESAHVLPALIHRFFLAKADSFPEVRIWGTGKPLREFMYSSDCAKQIICLAESVRLQELFDAEYSGKISHLNVGSGQEISILQLATIISEKVGYSGPILFDNTISDGTPRKLLCTKNTEKLSQVELTPLNAGISQTIAWFTQYLKKLPER